MNERIIWNLPAIKYQFVFNVYISFDTSFDHSISCTNARQRSYPRILFIKKKMVQEDKENINLYSNLTT